MRLTLATRHRTLVLLTGDDARSDEPAGLVVSLDSADLTPAPDSDVDDDYEPDEDDRFGFSSQQ